LTLISCGQHIIEGEFVSLCSQTTYDPHRYIGKKRFLAERFASKNIGKVNFNERYPGSGKCVTQGNTGMRISGRIDDNEVYFFGSRLLDSVYQLSLSVALKVIKTDAPFFS
jgi:hypothetical protein